MLIGDRYSDKKLYRGIKHYDHLPLTSGDIHEYADIIQVKNELLLDNYIGSGTLNEPVCSISSNGISLTSHSKIIIEGDIALIDSDAGTPIVSKSAIDSAGYSEGLLCIVGWYQLLTATSTLRAYGGVNNSILPNDILDPTLQMQVSSRYQLRWDTVILDANTYAGNNPLQFSLLNRDATGEPIPDSTSTITTGLLQDDIRRAAKPASMTYAVSDLYIVPILYYKYLNSTISDAKAYPSRKLIAETQEIIVREEESHTMTAISEVQDITINLNFSEILEDDIIEVYYNGVLLVKDTHYTMNITAKSITLLVWTSEADDSLHVRRSYIQKIIK